MQERGEPLVEIIYGTGNPAKIAFMERCLKGLPVEIVGMARAAKEKGIILADVAETGATPLENARIKAERYYQIFQCPVFSCDSGLYLWNHATGEPLPEEEQPGLHVRGRGDERLDDEQLLAHYIRLVKRHGAVRARYKNAICLIWKEDLKGESMEEDLWGEAFLLTDVPHSCRRAGFPLDSISVDLATGKYYYDKEENSQDKVAGDNGFYRFFQHFLEKNIWKGSLVGKMR